MDARKRNLYSVVSDKNVGIDWQKQRSNGLAFSCRERAPKTVPKNERSRARSGQLQCRVRRGRLRSVRITARSCCRPVSHPEPLDAPRCRKAAVSFVMSRCRKSCDTVSRVPRPKSCCLVSRISHPKRSARVEHISVPKRMRSGVVRSRHNRVSCRLSRRPTEQDQGDVSRPHSEKMQERLSRPQTEQSWCVGYRVPERKDVVRLSHP